MSFSVDRVESAVLQFYSSGGAAAVGARGGVPEGREGVAAEVVAEEDQGLEPRHQNQSRRSDL